MKLSEEIKQILNLSVMIENPNERDLIIKTHKALLPMVEQLEKENEALKCCGNCKYMFVGCFVNHEAQQYCGSWEYDGMTREQRQL